MATDQRVPGTRLDTADFRRVVGRFTTGVTVATTVHKGRQRAMTANSFTSVSLEPPLVLLCVDKTARFHDEVLASGVFGISVLGDQHESASRHFAVRGGNDDPTRFVGVPHEVGPMTGVVLLSEALATLECTVWATHPGGDHTIVVGEVLRVGERREPGTPLLYFEGSYHRL
jgi:flavin reductase (DIM6/NTAB) family NADH-FMN oxidoreductase RutF